MKLATVRIKSDSHPGGVLINQKDFDPKKHVPFDEAPAPAAKKPGRAKRAK